MSQDTCHSTWFIWHLNPKHPLPTPNETHSPRLWFGWMLFALQYTFFLRCILLHVFLYGISSHKFPGILCWFVASDRRLLYKLPLVARIWTNFEDTPPTFILISGLLASPRQKTPLALLYMCHLLISLMFFFMFQSLMFTVILSASFSLKSRANQNVFELIILTLTVLN